MIVSCRAAGLTPIARVPDLNTFPLSRILDLGAKGVMIPRVETGEQMQDAVGQLKYAPRGRRARRSVWRMTTTNHADRDILRRPTRRHW